jgi:hypothetical protein
MQCFHKSREVPKGYDCFDENARFTVRRPASYWDQTSSHRIRCQDQMSSHSSCHPHRVRRHRQALSSACWLNCTALILTASARKRRKELKLVTSSLVAVVRGSVLGLASHLLGSDHAWLSTARGLHYHQHAGTHCTSVALTAPGDCVAHIAAQLLVLATDESPVSEAPFHQLLLCMQDCLRQHPEALAGLKSAEQQGGPLLVPPGPPGGRIQPPKQL